MISYEPHLIIDLCIYVCIYLLIYLFTYSFIKISTFFSFLEFFKKLWKCFRQLAKGLFTIHRIFKSFSFQIPFSLEEKNIF